MEARIQLLHALTALAPPLSALVAARPSTHALLPEDAMLQGYAPLEDVVDRVTTAAQWQDDGLERLRQLLDAMTSLYHALTAVKPPAPAYAPAPGSAAARHAEWGSAQQAACVGLGAALGLQAAGGMAVEGGVIARVDARAQVDEGMEEEVIVWQGTLSTLSTAHASQGATAPTAVASTAYPPNPAAAFYQQYEAQDQGTPVEEQWLAPTQALAPVVAAPEHNLLRALQPEHQGGWGLFGGAGDGR